MIWHKVATTYAKVSFFKSVIDSFEVTLHTWKGRRNDSVTKFSKQILSHFLCPTIKSTTAATTTTTATADVSKRNWSSLGVRGSWGKRSSPSSSHYILFSHQDFNSKSKVKPYYICITAWVHAYAAMCRTFSRYLTLNQSQWQM